MDRDFTLEKYRVYVNAIKKNYQCILSFSDYLKAVPKPESFAIIRHDVDRKPFNALIMAKLEHELDIKSTYYFRIKSHTFKPEIIKQIAELGHEIGFHYESLSDANGDFEVAYREFCTGLAKFRKIIPVKTISMHGRPLKPYDNRDLWKYQSFHDKLLQELEILGEIYLDIDYTKIAYINDTGRNWLNGKANLRDKVHSKIKADFNSSNQLLDYLNHNPHSKLIFQIHPERWSSKTIEWYVQAIKDFSINQIKKVISGIRE